MAGTTKIELVHPHSNKGKEHGVLTNIHIEEQNREKREAVCESDVDSAEKR